MMSNLLILGRLIQKLSSWQLTKGQLISKFQNSPKKRTKKYDTSGRLVFVRFLGEIEDTKKTFRNKLTFK